MHRSRFWDVNSFDMHGISDAFKTLLASPRKPYGSLKQLLNSEQPQDRCSRLLQHNKYMISEIKQVLCCFFFAL